MFFTGWLQITPAQASPPQHSQEKANQATQPSPASPVVAEANFSLGTAKDIIFAQA